MFYMSVKISQLGLPGILPIDEYRFPLSPDEKKKVKIISFKEKDADIDLTYFIFIQKFMKNGNIYDLTKKYISSKGAINDKMNPTIRSKIIFGVACTMKQLHARNVIHRNLKNKDILLDNLEPKIGSFHFAKFLKSTKEYDKDFGTPIYMAPELIFNNHNEYCGFPIDVYSFGVFLYLMFTTDYKTPKNMKPYIDNFYGYISKGWRPKRPDLIPDHYWYLTQQCWKQDPNERPTFAEITEILKNDKYAIEEFGMKTDLDKLHEYQARINKY